MATGYCSTLGSISAMRSPFAESLCLQPGGERCSQPVHLAIRHGMVQQHIGLVVARAACSASPISSTSDAYWPGSMSGGTPGG